MGSGDSCGVGHETRRKRKSAPCAGLELVMNGDRGKLKKAGRRIVIAQMSHLCNSQGGGVIRPWSSPGYLTPH